MSTRREAAMKTGQVQLRCSGCLADWTYRVEARIVHRLADVLRQGQGTAAVVLMLACALGGFLGTPGAASQQAIAVAIVMATVCAIAVCISLYMAASKDPHFRLQHRTVPTRRILARTAREVDAEIYESLASRLPEERRMLGVDIREHQWLLGQRQLDRARSTAELIQELERYVDKVELTITLDALTSGRLTRAHMNEIVALRREQFANGHRSGPLSTQATAA